MNHEETDNDGRDGGEAKNLCGFLAGSNDLIPGEHQGLHSFSG